MGPISVLLSVAYTTWSGLLKICCVVYSLVSNVLLIVVTLLALLLPLWLFAKRKFTTRPKVSMAFANPDQIITEVFKLMPVSAYTGWQLVRVQKGLRILQKMSAHLSHDLAVISGSLCTDCKPKSALYASLDLEELLQWFGFSDFSPKQLIPARKLSSRSMETPFSSDTISYRQSVPAHYLWRMVHDIIKSLDLERFVNKFVTLPPVERLQEIVTRRVWQVKEDGQCCILMLPERPDLAGHHWTCYIFSLIEKTRVSATHATVVSLPFNTNMAYSEAERFCAQLISLREHIAFRKLGMYGKSTYRKQHTPENISKTLQPTATIPTTISEIDSVTTKTVPSDNSAATNSIPSVTTNTISSEKANIPPTTKSDIPMPVEDKPSDVPVVKLKELSPPPSRYDSLIQQSIESMLTVSQGTEADGWTHMGVTKDVEVMKKTASKNGPPVNTIKGKGVICAPPEFVLQFLLDPDNSKKLDELLKEVQMVEKIDDFAQIGRLMYKSVWPTSARDFVIISYCERTDETTRIRGAFSVVHPEAPEDPSYVRAELLVGGYIIRDRPSDPNSCEITYISQSDVKGNIPMMVVNKVMASQPMCVARLRDHVEPLYNNPQKNRAAIEALKATPLPPPYKAPVEHRESPIVEEELPETDATISTHTNDTGDDINTTTSSTTTTTQSMNNCFENSGWEMVHEEPIVDIFMEDIPPGAGNGSNNLDAAPHGSANKLNGVVQHSNTTTSDTQPLPSLSPRSLSTESGMIRTYTPYTASSDEDGTATDEDDNDSIGSLRLKKKYKFNAPDLFKEQWKNTKRTSLTGSAKLTADVISYPMRDNKVDFRTMGNQAAAELLQEVFYTSSVDIRDPNTFKILSGGWKYQFFEKKVLVLQKKHPNSPFHSLMGKGIIGMAPDKVYETLRNPRTRYTYDNLLKSMDFVKKIDDDLYILYMMLETTQCFMKKARDLCILISERSEAGRDMVVGVSVSVPECPPDPDLNRARVFSSGWVVEPVEVNGNIQTSVTYLLQVDFGGVPARLVNYISKRQPLAIAYLRDYLLGDSY